MAVAARGVTDAATTAHIRRQEAMNACQMIGATFHESLANDLEIFYDRPTLARLAAMMREVAPEIVLTHSPADYMEDHMNACRLAVTAAFARGMPNLSSTRHGQPRSADYGLSRAAARQS